MTNADRPALLKSTRKLLQDSGFELSDDADTKNLSFDIMARDREKLLIIKALSNVDGATITNTNELKILAGFLKGVPMIIAERSTKYGLERGVLYLRYGITIMSFDTLSDILVENTPPVAYSASGGFYVELDGGKVRGLREASGLSIGDLARALGVSRKSIQMYEGGRSATIDIGVKLEELFKVQLIIPLDPFAYDAKMQEVRNEMALLSPEEHDVFSHLQSIGYDVTPTQRCPFNAFTHKDTAVILTAVGDLNARVRARLKAIHRISDISKKDALFISNKDTSGEGDIGIPVIKRERLKKIEDPGEIMDIVKGR